jgi:hypothetical protein
LSSKQKIGLGFSAEVSDRVRARIDYSFRVFCSIYGYQISSSKSEGVWFQYGSGEIDSTSIKLPCWYNEDRMPKTPPHFHQLPHLFPPDSRVKDFPCFHPCSDGSNSIDWLAEVFEWISGHLELKLGEKDSIGRISQPNSVFYRFGLDPHLPYAAAAMAGFNTIVKKHTPGLDKPTPPSNLSSFLIASTHDIDFVPRSIFGSFYRVFKNFAISLIIHKDCRLAFSIFISLLKSVLFLRGPFEQIASIAKTEEELSARSSWYFIPRNQHRRDGNYRVSDPHIKGIMRNLVESKHEVGVHGSYCSLSSKDGLLAEYEIFRKQGFNVIGGRQHWLRFNFDDKSLFESVMIAKANYDCSIGFSSEVGFRFGACFPFPPYDFQNERAYPFLEIPLVIMDTALYSAYRSEVEREAVSRKVIETAKYYGWGGISILWHNTGFGGVQLPTNLAGLYWDFLKSDISIMPSCKVFGIVKSRMENNGLKCLF